MHLERAHEIRRTSTLRVGRIGGIRTPADQAGTGYIGARYGTTHSRARKKMKRNHCEINGPTISAGHTEEATNQNTAEFNGE